MAISNNYHGQNNSCYSVPIIRGHLVYLDFWFDVLATINATFCSMKFYFENQQKTNLSRLPLCCYYGDPSYCPITVRVSSTVCRPTGYGPIRGGNGWRIDTILFSCSFAVVLPER